MAVKHRTPCRCHRCREERLQRSATLRAKGLSINAIALVLNVGVGTVHRMLRAGDVSMPKEIYGRNGKTYRYVSKV